MNSTGNVRINVTSRGVRATTVAVEKQYYILCVCVCVCVFVALGMQPALRMRHIVICGLPRSTIFFPIISQTARFSKKKKKVTEHKMCVLIFSTTSVWNISHSKKNCARYDQKRYTGHHVKYPLFLSHFNEICISSTGLWKTLKYKISWKSVQWETRCSMRTDGQTRRN